MWGIVRVHLVPAPHPPSFSPIGAIVKKLIFYRRFQVGYNIAKRKTRGADGFRTNQFLSTCLFITCSYYIQKSGTPKIQGF